MNENISDVGSSLINSELFWFDSLPLFSLYPYKTAIAILFLSLLHKKYRKKCQMPRDSRAENLVTFFAHFWENSIGRAGGGGLRQCHTQWFLRVGIHERPPELLWKTCSYKKEVAKKQFRDRRPISQTWTVAVWAREETDLVLRSLRGNEPQTAGQVRFTMHREVLAAYRGTLVDITYSADT